MINMVKRKGLGKGRGKGYKNMMGKDPMVHSQSAKGIRQPQKIPRMRFKPPQKIEILKLYRVPYGKKNTPLEQREYRMDGVSSVGTIQEWVDYLEDNNILINTQIMADLTMNEKKKLTKMLKFKDTDSDGVADVLDCDPTDPNKQDDVEKILEDIGAVERKPKVNDKLPEGLSEIEFDPSVEGKVSGVKRTIGKFEAKAGALFKKGKDVVAEKLKERKEKAEADKEEMLTSINHPKIKEIEKQRARVEHLKESIANEPDSEDEKDLFEELEREQKQLAELHEHLTEINIQEINDKDLKVLAVRHKPSGIADFLEIGDNPYETELLRRIQARKKLAEEIKEAEKKPVGTGFFEF